MLSFQKPVHQRMLCSHLFLLLNTHLPLVTIPKNTTGFVSLNTLNKSLNRANSQTLVCFDFISLFHFIFRVSFWNHFLLTTWLSLFCSSHLTIVTNKSLTNTTKDLYWIFCQIHKEHPLALNFWNRCLYKMLFESIFNLS